MLQPKRSLLRFPLPLPRRLLSQSIAVAFLIVAAGCGSQQAPDAVVGESDLPSANTVANPNEQSLAQQIADVEASQSERIFLNAPVVDSDLTQLAQLESLSDLLLDGGAVTDAGIAAIVTCPNLKHLRLRFSPIGDDGLRQIAQLKDLEILNLPHSACTAAGIGELADLPKLRQLRLGSDRATAEICQAISRLESLRSLHLIDIPVDDENLLRLADLKNLRSLYIDGGRVSDAGWQALFAKRSDLHVHIDQTHHDLDPGKHDPDH